MHTSIRGLVAASLLAGSGLTAAPALAQDETAPPQEITVTANVALTTDYRFRGVSLSGGDPAIQGGITVTHNSGFYFGAWSSSIHDNTGIYGDQELDLFGGWGGEFNGIGIDAGLLYYSYPSGHVGKGNYFEPYASVSATVGPAKAKLGVAYAWKQDSLGDDDNLYLFGNLDIGVPTTPLTLSGHLGYADGAQSPDILAGGNDRNGLDWSLGASAALIGPLSFSVSYIGVQGYSIKNFTDDTVVATLTATF